MKYVFLLIVLTHFLAGAQPKVSFTFDDGLTKDRAGLSLVEWNGMLLEKMEEHGVQATFFVTTFDKTDSLGEYLLTSWDQAGHHIANHTYTHPNFNSKNTSLQRFKDELIGADTIISSYSNYRKLFRFPYLKEGNTNEKVQGFRTFMDSLDYRNGYVTIDASDWYIDSRLRNKLKEDPELDLDGFRDFYVEHMFERAMFYESLAYKLTGRHIKHTLLLHHNLAAALFIDDLVEKFKQEGWEIVSSSEAFGDPIFSQIPIYAGESLIWALAKDTGEYDELLRYPAEDGKYEEEKMNKLGL